MKGQSKDVKLRKDSMNFSKKNMGQFNQLFSITYTGPTTLIKMVQSYLGSRK